MKTAHFSLFPASSGHRIFGQGAQRRTRTFGLAVLAAFAVALLGLLTAPYASAHDQLTQAVPVQNSTVQQTPEKVTLTFSGDLQPIGHEIKVNDAAGKNVALGDAQLNGTAITQPLQDTVPNGTYTVEWRVVSSDGHPVNGTYTFTVNAPAGSAPATDMSVPPVATNGTVPSSTAPSTTEAPATATSAASPSTDNASSGASTVWLWIVIVVLAIIIVALLVLLSRRAKRNTRS